MAQAGHRLTEHHPRRIAAGGFSLVELLVVIGIIVLLIGLALVALAVGRTKAEQARMASDLQAIAVALDAYKADFGDYPRIMESPPAGVFPVTPHKFSLPLTPLNPIDLANAQCISGAELLCWALVGPYEATPTADFTSAMANAAANPKFPISAFGFPPSNIQPGDAAAGPGFRLNASGRGQVYASYLNIERFKIGRQTGYERYLAILDSQKMPILYFPMNPRPAGAGWTAIADRSTAATYDLRDNEAPFLRSTDVSSAAPLNRMLVMLGDRNLNGVIDVGGEIPLPTLPYLLWSAGPDGLYGPTNPGDSSEVNNCDDVTNIKY